MAEFPAVIRRVLAFILVATLVMGAPVARGVPPRPFEINSPQDDLDVTDTAQPTAAKALGDTVWIADWSFDGAPGVCTSAGWIKYDNYILNTHVDSDFWHVDNRFDGLTDGAAVPTVL